MEGVVEEYAGFMPVGSIYGYSDQNRFVQCFKDTLTKTASLSASRSCVNDIMVPSLQFAKNTEVSGIADVKRPSGGCEKHAGRVIPHCVGPTTLLRHSLPAHFSQPLSFADLIRVSFTFATRPSGGCGRDRSIHKISVVNQSILKYGKPRRPGVIRLLPVHPA